MVINKKILLFALCINSLQIYSVKKPDHRRKLSPQKNQTQQPLENIKNAVNAIEQSIDEKQDLSVVNEKMKILLNIISNMDQETLTAIKPQTENILDNLNNHLQEYMKTQKTTAQRWSTARNILNKIQLSLDKAMELGWYYAPEYTTGGVVDQEWVNRDYYSKPAKVYSDLEDTYHLATTPISQTAQPAVDAAKPYLVPVIQKIQPYTDPIVQTVKPYTDPIVKKVSSYRDQLKDQLYHWGIIRDEEVDQSHISRGPATVNDPAPGY